MYKIINDFCIRKLHDEYPRQIPRDEMNVDYIQFKEDVVGIGTTFLDNVYRIKEISSVGTRGLVTCFVHTGLTTSTIGNYNAAGIATVSPVGINSQSPTSLGKFSWGRLTGITRSTTPISIGVTGSTIGLSTALGITTFSTIQRRGDGLNDSGALVI